MPMLTLEIPGLGEKKSRNLLQKMDSNKNCQSTEPGIELNIGTQSVQVDFFRKRKTIQNVTNKSWANMG